LRTSDRGSWGAMAYISTPFLLFRGALCYKVRAYRDHAPSVTGPYTYTTPIHGWVSFLADIPATFPAGPQAFEESFSNFVDFSRTVALPRAFFFQRVRLQNY